MARHLSPGLPGESSLLARRSRNLAGIRPADEYPPFRRIRTKGGNSALTLKDCIDFVDGIEPNDYTEGQKTAWVSEVEGMVITDVLLRPVREFTPLDYGQDKDRPLAVLPPHDKLYRDYLQARIHFANGEYDRYSGSMALFNAEWGEFVRWFARNYSPADKEEE